MTGSRGTHVPVGRCNASAALAFLALLIAVPAARAEEQAISLRSGWNLISFAVSPTNPNPAAVVSGLGANFVALWSYDAAAQTWSTYPAPAGVPAITAIVAGRGYWIRVNAISTLTVAGDATAAPSAVSLVNGWTLIGPVSDQPVAYDLFFRDHDVREIWMFDAQAGQFKGVDVNPPGAEQFTQLVPGKGYWVRAGTASTIEPSLGTALPGDVDWEPFLTVNPTGPTPWTTVSPGDDDVGDDNFYDRPETQRAVSLHDDLDRATLSLFNAATAGVTSYRVNVANAAATPWLRFEVTDPETGERTLVDTVSGAATGTDSESVEIVANRAGLLPGEHEAIITVTSNGKSTLEPNRTIDLTLTVAPLDGDYRVLAKIETVDGKRADMHNPRLLLTLYDDGAGLRGLIDPAKTLLMPKLLHLGGSFYEEGTNRFAVSGSFELPAGHDDNPYQASLRRDITLIGDRTGVGDAGVGPLDLKGEYRETIRNVLGDRPIYLAGTFTAQRISGKPSVGITQVTSTGGTIANPSTFPKVVSERRLITNVQVNVRATHPLPSDLKFTLISPMGTSIVLRDRLATPVDDLRFDETDPTVDSLGLLNGQPSNGSWSLVVHDMVVGNTGSITSWDLNIEGTPLHSITGTITGFGSGDQVILTGCGFTVVATTDASGFFRFPDMIDCLYRITLVKSGRQRLSTEVALNGEDFSGVDFNPGTAPPGVSVPLSTPPSDGTLKLVARTTRSNAGQTVAGDGGEDAVDSATFDIDRPPRPSAPPGTEDSNRFTGTVDSLTQTNALGANTMIDAPVGNPGSHYRARVSIGHPVSGRSVAGANVLTIGSSL